MFDVWDNMKYINIIAAIKFWIISILVALFLLCILVFVCRSVIQTIDDKRKIKLLKSYGCERYLSGVPSVGNGAFYSWKTTDYKINIDERDITRMKYKQLIKILENKTTI